MTSLTCATHETGRPMRSPSLWLMVMALVMMLTGCGSLRSVTAEVSSYGQWPAERKPARYAFERLPSQQVQADLQTRVEAAAAPVLARKGFILSPLDQADVLVQVAVQSRTQSRYVDDPWGRRLDGSWFGGVFGTGGIWGRHGGVGIGMSFEPPMTQMQVDLLIRDRRSNQTLYETHALHSRAGSVVESLMAPLFEAALQDFPAQAISPRQVTVDLPAPEGAEKPKP